MNNKLKIISSILTLAVIGFAIWYFVIPSDYYEYHADSASECLEGELYDEEYSVCYFDYYCETDEECAEVDERYGKLLNALADEYQEDDHEYVDYGSNSEPEEETIESTTEIEEAVAPKQEQTTMKEGQLSVQEIMETLIPADKLSQIVEYKEDSDGRDGSLAYVEPTDSPDEWVLGYDPKDTYNRSGKYRDINEFLSTLVHEYGHIIMLDSTQVEAAAEDAEYIECPENESIIDEGCALSNSYIHQYINAFWNDELRDQAYDASMNESEEDFAYELYKSNPTHYVTEYAATNSIEDMAESFAIFVMRERVSTPVTISEKKTDFFYAYPELVQLRRYMRGGMVKVLAKTQ